MTYFTSDQVKLLLRPIHPQRVLQLKGMSYVEGYDIRAELNRILGFGRWSQEITGQQLICETEVKTNAGKPAWYVVYKSTIRLRIEAPDGTPLTHYDGSHVGESTHPVRGEAHGNALTNSETYALRRCAINLGDQFGLSLYNKGSLEPIVRWTLVRPDEVTADTEDVLQVTAEEAAFPQKEEVAPPRKPPAARKAPSRGNSLEEDIKGAQSIQELRTAWKRAGAEGKLQDHIVLEDGEKITVQDFLYRRSDDLSLPKSTGDSPSPAGEGMAGPGVPE
jgi:hypothetical protein